MNDRRLSESEPSNASSNEPNQIQSQKQFNPFVYFFYRQIYWALSIYFINQCVLFNFTEKLFVRYCIQFFSMIYIARFYKIKILQTDLKLNLMLHSIGPFALISTWLFYISTRLLGQFGLVFFYFSTLLFLNILQRKFISEKNMYIISDDFVFDSIISKKIFILF